MKNDKHPKISVVIPVYNTESFLRECLDVVINQTLKEIEIICVDDGSTDSSLSILQEYKQRDNRIIVLTQENKGAGAARNAGLDIAKGEYLSFLDSDDFFDVKMLEKMYKTSENFQTDFTVCFSRTFNNETKKIRDINWPAMDIQKDVFCYKDALDVCHAFDFFTGWSWDKLFRKSFIDEHGLRFQEISHSNDGFFVFYAMYAAKRITILREFMIKHRCNRRESIEMTHDKNPFCFLKMHEAVKEGLERLDVFPEVKERYVIWVLKYSLWLLSVIKTFQAFTDIHSMLQNDIFSKNKICDLPLGFIEGKELYDELKKVMAQSSAEYLFNLRNNAKEERDCLEGELEALLASWSFRLGRVLTWFPRKVRGIFIR